MDDASSCFLEDSERGIGDVTACVGFNELEDFFNIDDEGPEFYEDMVTDPEEEFDDWPEEWPETL